MICTLPFALAGLLLAAGSPGSPVSPAEPAIAKRIVREDNATNLVRPQAWQRCEKGFELRDGVFVCDNGRDAKAQRGLTQTVVLNQTRPEPFVAVAWSKAADVSGSANAGYSLYLDLTNTDGTNVWGKIASFNTGTHDWQRREVAVLPEKPVKSVDFYLLMRNHAGKAWFRDPALRLVKAPPGACLFDGVSVVAAGAAQEGFQIRDVAAASDFLRVQGREVPKAKPYFEGDALGLKLQWQKTTRQDVSFFDVVLTDLKGTDRAVTLVFAVPVGSQYVRLSSLTKQTSQAGKPDVLLWLEDPRRRTPIEAGRDYVNATQFHIGSNGRLSRYPLGAVAAAATVTALALDPAYPAFFRIGYSAGTGELYLAYDLGLAREKPKCRLRFCRYTVKPDWGFRAALRVTTSSFPRPFAAAPHSKGCGCRSPASARCRDGKILASSSRRAITKPGGTTSTASSPSTTPNRCRGGCPCPSPCRGPSRRPWPRPGGWRARAAPRLGHC